MFTHAPDPYPGRCRNLRPSLDYYGYPSMARCLDYEAEPHQCSFEDLPKRHDSTNWQANSLAELSKPKPWVKP